LGRPHSLVPDPTNNHARHDSRWLADRSANPGVQCRPNLCVLAAGGDNVLRVGETVFERLDQRFRTAAVFPGFFLCRTRSPDMHPAFR